MAHPLKLGAAAGIATLGGLYVWAKGTNGPAPDYAAADAWFVRETDGPKQCDVFYAHPTTDAGLLRWNMEPIEGDACTGLIEKDADLLQGQAGAWRDDCNLWAPKYRQMGFLSQAWVHLPTAPDSKVAPLKASIELAYNDLKHAFIAFLEQRPDKRRPFMIAAHSQGAIMMSKVIAQCVEGTEHEATFVAGYLAGGYLPVDLFGTVFKNLHICSGPEDTRCLISYDTRTAAFQPEILNNLGGGFGLWAHHLYWLLHEEYCEKPDASTDDVNKARVQINPATWSTEAGGVHLGVNTSYKQKEANGYSEPFSSPEGFGSHTTVTDKAVIVEDPESWLAGAGNKGGPGNMHPIDIHFWFYNIKANVAQRIAAWRSSK